MAFSFELAQENLDSLILYSQEEIPESKRNEATTRLHLIDRLLFECLGWDRKDCTAENRLDATYTDYSLNCPECLLIVEAKREGVYFELPSGSKKQVYNIQYFKKHASSVYEAIDQALKYCQSRGSPYGIVCNGHQIVAFLGSRIDGRPPEQGKALVFDSLQTLKEHFLYAWQCISKPGVLKRRLSFELQDVTIAPVPEKLSAKIPGYPGFKSRNPLQTDLQILSDLFIEDIIRTPGTGKKLDFIKQCYCSSGALSQYAIISKEILRSRYSSLSLNESKKLSTEPATTKKGLNPKLIAESLTRRPILLIGDVGVGKTMFIRNLCEVEAKEVFNKSIVIYVDFGSKPTIAEDIQLFTIDEIKSQLHGKYGIDIEERNFIHAIFHRDIERFDKGIYKDLKESDPDTFKKHKIEYLETKMLNKDEYISSSLNHIVKGRNKQVVIFLDNVDQRPEQFQEAAFLTGQTMADNWPVTVFISIRPETFNKSKTAGTLSAYHPRAFTISPPRVDEVISKRFKYGINLLTRGILLGSPSKISIKTKTLADYLGVLDYSFSNNKYLIEFLENICGGNIRLALDLLRIFIGSGHIDTEKILAIYRESGDYLVPLHEFLRAVTYVDHQLYYPLASVILNLFDISSPDGKEHFLASILLAQMLLWTQDSKLDGFVHISQIYSHLQALGYQPHQIAWSIDRLLFRNLLEPSISKPKNANKSMEQKSDSSSFYRITTIGAYYVRRLIARFPYVDAMIIDTPILNAQVRSQIYNDFSIKERLKRASIFTDYLDSEWEPLSEYELSFQWPVVKKRINRDINYVTGKITIREDILDEEQSLK